MTSRFDTGADRKISIPECFDVGRDEYAAPRRTFSKFSECRVCGKRYEWIEDSEYEIRPPREALEAMVEHKFAHDTIDTQRRLAEAVEKLHVLVERLLERSKTGEQP